MCKIFFIIGLYYLSYLYVFHMSFKRMPLNLWKNKISQVLLSNHGPWNLWWQFSFWLFIFKNNPITATYACPTNMHSWYWFKLSFFNVLLCHQQTTKLWQHHMQQLFGDSKHLQPFQAHVNQFKQTCYEDTNNQGMWF